MKRLQLKFPWLTLILTFPAVLLYLVQGADSHMQYSRELIFQGQLWRMVTCHWTHWNFSHFIWDILTFICLAVFIEMFDRKILATGILAAVPACSFTVMFLLPQMSLYRGLSGLDALLFVLAIFCLTSKYSKFQAILIRTGTILILLTKVSYEIIAKDPLFVSSSNIFIPVPAVHAAGALTALLLVFKYSSTLHPWTLKKLSISCRNSEHAQATIQSKT